MPSTAGWWHPIQVVNAYDIRLVGLRDHHLATALISSNDSSDSPSADGNGCGLTRSTGMPCPDAASGCSAAAPL